MGTMKKILVIDDNKNITNLVDIILQSSGYDCTQVNSGKEALRVLYDDSLNYDLILMDMAMPETSGVDILKKLSEDGLLKKKKVVFFTASSLSEAQREELKKIGALAAMKKPFTKAELLQFIVKHTT